MLKTNKPYFVKLAMVLIAILLFIVYYKSREYNFEDTVYIETIKTWQPWVGNGVATDKYIEIEEDIKKEVLSLITSPTYYKTAQLGSSADTFIVISLPSTKGKGLYNCSYRISSLGDVAIGDYYYNQGGEISYGIRGLKKSEIKNLYKQISILIGHEAATVN